jgi:hypothetical protein
MDTQKNTATIPDGVEFSDLKIARDTDGRVSFDWTPIERICEASGIDVSIMREGPEDNVCSLIIAWYESHLAHGGDPDPVAQDIINEAIAEDSRGGGLSYPPGRA